MARCTQNTTVCDKVCQWPMTGQWFTPGTPVSSTNKTDCHDITEILLTVALNIITLNHMLKILYMISQSSDIYFLCHWQYFHCIFLFAILRTFLNVNWTMHAKWWQYLIYGHLWQVSLQDINSCIYQDIKVWDKNKRNISEWVIVV